MGMFDFLSRRKAKAPSGRGPATSGPYPFGGLPDTVPGGQYVPSGIGPAADMWNANDLPGAWPLGIPNVDSRGQLDATGQLQPLPQTLPNQLLRSSSTRYRPFSQHSFVQARLPDPGAPQWTFDALALVEFSPIGTGIMNQGEILALEGAPYFPNFMVPIQGLGGIVQGEIVLQPLMLDPDTTAQLQINM